MNKENLPFWTALSSLWNSSIVVSDDKDTAYFLFADNTMVPVNEITKLNSASS